MTVRVSKMHLLILFLNKGNIVIAPVFIPTVQKWRNRLYGVCFHHEKLHLVNVQCHSQQVLLVTFKAVISVSSKGTSSTPILTQQERINTQGFWHTLARVHDTIHSHIITCTCVHICIQTERYRCMQTHTGISAIGTYWNNKGLCHDKNTKQSIA